MRIFLAASVFVFAFVFASGAPDFTEKDVDKREEAALQKCNASFPVQEDQREKIAAAVLKGERITVGDPSKWCHLNCFLQEVGFFDADGNMRSKQIFDFIIKNNPELVSSSHVLTIQLFMINRATKGIQDRCKRAFVCFKQFVESLAVCSLSKTLNEVTNIKKRVADAVLEGNEIPKELHTDTTEFFRMLKTVL